MKGARQIKQAPRQVPTIQTEQGTPTLEVKHGKFEVSIEGWAAIVLGLAIVGGFLFYVDRRWPHIRQGAKAKLRRKRK